MVTVFKFFRYIWNLMYPAVLTLISGRLHSSRIEKKLCSIFPFVASFGQLHHPRSRFVLVQLVQQVLFQWHLCMCMARVEPYRSTVWYYLMVCVCRQHGWNYGRRGRWCHLHSHHRGHHILQVRALNRCFYPVGELLQILNFYIVDDKVELIWVLHVHIHVHVRVRVFPYCLKFLARYTISLMKHKIICFFLLVETIVSIIVRATYVLSVCVNLVCNCTREPG